MSFFRKLSRFFDNEHYKKNPVAQNLTEEQFIALNVGAINAEQTGYYCDSLTTGADVEGIKENLENYYGIEDRESAIGTLQWLFGRGHRVFFDAIKGAASGKAGAIDYNELEDDEHERADEFLENLQSAVDGLIEEKFLTSREDLASHSITAWDMGRFVLVTRCCFDAEYISEEEAWHCINNALAECREFYSSWEELASDYVIGRAMWSGYGMTLIGIMTKAQNLLGDAESPWKRVQFSKSDK